MSVLFLEHPAVSDSSLTLWIVLRATLGMFSTHPRLHSHVRSGFTSMSSIMHDARRVGVDLIAVSHPLSQVAVSIRAGVRAAKRAQQSTHAFRGCEAHLRIARMHACVRVPIATGLRTGRFLIATEHPHRGAPHNTRISLTLLLTVKKCVKRSMTRGTVYGVNSLPGTSQNST